MKRGLIAALIAALSTAVLAVSAYAAPYPEKPVTVIVPFAPGGSTDMVARMMTAKMTERLGQPFIVENKPGATGAIGAAQVKKSAADGYTVLCASIGIYATNPFLQKSLAYDPARDFDLLTVAVRSMQDYEAFGIRELIPEKGVRGFKSMIVIREVVGFDPARAVLER